MPRTTQANSNLMIIPRVRGPGVSTLMPRGCVRIFFPLSFLPLRAMYDHQDLQRTIGHLLYRDFVGLRELITFFLSDQFHNEYAFVLYRCHSYRCKMSFG